jgi:molecular chaperone DnaK
MNTAWTAASEELYKASQGAGAEQGGGDGHQQPHTDGEPQQGQGAENVTDAEFEEVK